MADYTFRPEDEHPAPETEPRESAEKENASAEQDAPQNPQENAAGQNGARVEYHYAGPQINRETNACGAYRGADAGYVQNPYAPQNPYAQNPYTQGAYAQQNAYAGPRYGQYAYAQNPYAAPAAAPKKKEKKKIGAGLAALLVALCILFSAAGGVGGVLLARYLPSSGSSNTTVSNPPETGSAPAASSPSSTPSVVIVNNGKDVVETGTYAQVAAAVKDSVVEITTETVRTSQIYGQYVTGGAGSGVIISTDGVVITNYHVIDGAGTVTVRTTDGKDYPATVTASDSESDIALLKIEATGLTAATLGNSSALVVGQEVMAIGNPLGSLGGTVTNGIISALDREIEIDGQTMNLLQTNAAVNPGNSGGGLFNLGGELIGIVNAKSAGSDVEGLGFAIPINDAIEVMKELNEYGYVRGRVQLGITYYEVDSSSIYSNPFSAYSTPGIYVRTSELNPDLKSGDRIISVDGKEVSSAAGIKRALQGHKVGDTVEVTVVRSGRTVTVTATLYEKVPSGVKTEN
ncbi:MAG: trypsin-like peptidase domain-containing protein [Clostridia bacterium]|nr:trypsin-like peptidase domain-containing protein [Clostridia bacterium]